MSECPATQMTLFQLHLLLYKQLVSTLSLTSFILEQRKNYAGRYLLTHRYFMNITTFRELALPWTTGECAAVTFRYFSCFCFRH